LIATAFEGENMKIELTVKSDYCRTWGVWEGLREFAQNGMDAHDAGYPFSVERKPSGKARFFSKGSKITTESLLLGHSDKPADGARGRFGEGYKVGTLALLRAEKKVVIRTGAERWVFSFEASKAFGGAKVLTVTVSGAKEIDGVEVVVSDITPEEWAQFESRIILLDSDVKRFAMPYEGSILLDPEYRGKLYSRGIFVQELSGDYGYGYDLPLTLDRDRMLAKDVDIKWMSNVLLGKAMEAGVIGSDGVYSMLEREAPEFSEISEWSFSPGSPRNRTAESIGTVFVAKHGDKAVPVTSMEQADSVRSIGYTPVVVPKALKLYLEHSGVPTPESLLTWAVSRVYTPSELAPAEASALRYASEMFAIARPEACDIAVVDFLDGAQKVMAEGSNIFAAKGLLTDRSDLLLKLMQTIPAATRDEGWLSVVAHLTGGIE
jgi:hypothetical protein